MRNFNKTPDISELFRIITALFILSLLSGCLGGGGGGGDDTVISDDPAPPIPSRVNYYAGGPGGDPGTTGMTLLADDTITVDATFGLHGSYSPATNLYTLNLSPVPRMAMSAIGLGFELPIIEPSDGRFSFLVNETLQWEFGKHPTSGAFRLAAGNYIQVTVNNDIDGSGTTGVDLQLVYFGDAVESASLSWSQFISTFNNSAAPAYQRQASLAYHVMQRLYQPLQGAIQNFSTIAEQESALEAAGSGNVIALPVCSILNSSTGTFDISWIDGPGEIAGAVGPGDDFMISVNNCWLDDPDTTRDLLYSSGQQQFKGYAESTTPFRIAIDDVVINDLLITQTEYSGGGIITAGNTLFNTYSTATDRNGFTIELTPDVSGTINLVNTVQIAEAIASTITLPGEVGNFTASLLDDAITSAILEDTVSCPLGGSYDYELSSIAFSTGDTMSVTFNDCDQGTAGDSTILNGSYRLTATSFASIENLGFSLTLDSISFLDDIGTSIISGQMQFSRIVNSGISNEVSTSVIGHSLSLSENGSSASLSDFELSGTRSASGLTLGEAGETFALQISALSDPLSGTITSTFSGPESTAFQSGSARVTAPDSSNLWLTITDSSGTVSLELDSDGNGSAEDTITTNWDELH